MYHISCVRQRGASVPWLWYNGQSEDDRREEQLTGKTEEGTTE